MSELPCEIISMALDDFHDPLSLPRLWRPFSNDGDGLADHAGSGSRSDFVVRVISRGNYFSIDRHGFGGGDVRSGDFGFAVFDAGRVCGTREGLAAHPKFAFQYANN